MMPGEKPKNLKGTLAKPIAFMGRFKAAIVVLVFAVIFHHLQHRK